MVKVERINHSKTMVIAQIQLCETVAARYAMVTRGCNLRSQSKSWHCCPSYV
jgi:hypothetical protein